MGLWVSIKYHQTIRNATAEYELWEGVEKLHDNDLHEQRLKILQLFGKQNNKQRKTKVYQMKWNDKSWKNSDQGSLSPHQIMKRQNMDLVKIEEKLELERMQLRHKITMLLRTHCLRMFFETNNFTICEEEPSITRIFRAVKFITTKFWKRNLCFKV